MGNKENAFSWQNIKNSLVFYFKNYWWKLLIIFSVLVVDLVTKILLVPQDTDKWKEYIIINDVLTLTPTRNTGAGFSLLAGQTWLLITITFVFTVALTIFDILFKRKSKLFGVSTALIMSGAIGNLVDRLAFGYVRDFIYLKFINFPVFNVADMSLTFGIIILAIYIIFYYTKQKNDTKSQVEILENNSSEQEKNNENFDAKKDELNASDKIYISEASVENISQKNASEFEMQKDNNETNSQSKNGDDNAKDNS